MDTILSEHPIPFYGNDHKDSRCRWSRTILTSSRSPDIHWLAKNLPRNHTESEITGNLTRSLSLNADLAFSNTRSIGHIFEKEANSPDCNVRRLQAEADSDCEATRQITMEANVLVQGKGGFRSPVHRPSEIMRSCKEKRNLTQSSVRDVGCAIELRHASLVLRKQRLIVRRQWTRRHKYETPHWQKFVIKPSFDSRGRSSATYRITVVDRKGNFVAISIS